MKKIGLKRVFFYIILCLFITSIFIMKIFDNNINIKYNIIMNIFGIITMLIMGINVYSKKNIHPEELKKIKNNNNNLMSRKLIIFILYLFIVIFTIIHTYILKINIDYNQLIINIIIIGAGYSGITEINEYFKKYIPKGDIKND